MTRAPGKPGRHGDHSMAIARSRELRNRSRRAYRALDEAEQARSLLAETELDGIPEQIAGIARSERETYVEAHMRLTGMLPQELSDDDTLVGERAAASHAPENPRDVQPAREAAIALRNAGLTIVRLVERAVDRTHVDVESNAHERLRTQAIEMIGAAEALRDAVQEDFERDAHRLGEEGR